MNCLAKKKKNELIVLTKEKSGKAESSERYFFKYAFPCAHAKLKMGSLRKEEYNELKELFLQNNCPTKEVLEKNFKPAFERIKRLAEKLGKDIWDSEVLKEYWAKNHNEIIEAGDGMYGKVSESFKELCKIHIAEIIGKQGDKLIVKYEDKKRVVSSFLVPEAKIGEKVRIHFAYAIEKVEQY